MPRTFNGSSAFITPSVGALSGIGATTPFTIACICKLADTTDGAVVYLATSTIANSNANLQVFAGDWYVETAPGSDALLMAASTADNWTLIAVTKATGDVTPRAHKYVFGTNTWTHTDGTSTAADGSGTTANVRIGRYAADANFFNGHLEVAAVWNRVLSDAEVEPLAFSLQSWYAAAPLAGWKLDQQATTQAIIDWTGGGANQSAITGTTVSTNSVPVFSYGFSVPILSSSASVAATDVPYVPQRFVQLRDYGEVPWIQRDRRNALLVATAANDLDVPLLVPEHQRTTYSLSRYVDRRLVPQQPDRHLRALDATAANDLAPPLFSPADAQYWHLYNDVPLRDRRVQQRTYSDPNLLAPAAAGIPTVNPLAAAAYVSRRVMPSQRTYTDPSLLNSAQLENELLGGAETGKRARVPATHADRREVPQQRTYFDPTLLASALLEGVLLGGGDTTRHYLTAATHYSRRVAGQQRIYFDLTVLATALLENELLGGSETVKRHLPATHYDRREVPQQRRYVSDPGLLDTALLEGVLLGGADDQRRRYYSAAYWDRRRTVYQSRLSDLSLLLAETFDPTSVVGDLWRRLYTPVTHADRRETAFQPIRRTLYFDAGPDSPPLTLAWGVGGDLWHRYNPRRPARSWWPQWFGSGPYGGTDLCITIRPSSGLTLRPGTGITVRLVSTTTRPDSGDTIRPDTGVTEDPC